MSCLIVAGARRVLKTSQQLQETMASGPPSPQRNIRISKRCSMNFAGVIFYELRGGSGHVPSVSNSVLVDVSLGL